MRIWKFRSSLLLPLNSLPHLTVFSLIRAFPRDCEHPHARIVALTGGRRTGERSYYIHAQRSGTSMDPAKTGGTRRYVAVDLRSEVQRKGWGDSYGVSDKMANAARWRQAEEFRRFYFGDRLIARLRIRKRFR